MKSHILNVIGYGRGGQVTQVMALFGSSTVPRGWVECEAKGYALRKTVYLSLGSNLGDRAANLREGLRMLGELGEIKAVSSLFETEPIEMELQQGWFLNCTVAMETELMPKRFLGGALAVEQALGRRRTMHAKEKQPRTLDIDILFFGNAVMKSPGLTIPHPALQRRRFVLEPLAEIAPDLVHPVLKRSVRDLLQALPTGSGMVRKYEG